jgi:hypothetical protein
VPRKAVTAFALLIIMAAVAINAAAAAPVRLLLNGAEVASDVPPGIRNGVAVVPIRFVTAHLGYATSWDATTRQAVISGNGKLITLRAGCRSVTVNGAARSLTRPAELTGGRVMVPLRFVSEALGAQVAWDGAKRQISISRRPENPAAANTSVCIGPICRGPQLTPDGIPHTQFTLPPDIFRQ